MSTSASTPASSPRPPVGASVPALAGDWIATRSVLVSRPNRVLVVEVDAQLHVLGGDSVAVDRVDAPRVAGAIEGPS